MKELLCIGIFIVLAGCAPVLSDGQAAGPAMQGWANTQKTDMQRSQDLGECRDRCKAA